MEDFASIKKFKTSVLAVDLLGRYSFYGSTSFSVPAAFSEFSVGVSSCLQMFYGSCADEWAYRKKNGEKRNFILVFSRVSLYNNRIERAWGGESPLQFCRSFYFFVFDRYFWER